MAILASDAAAWTRWPAQVSEVVHGAASVSFELGLEATWAINVTGSRRVLEFAERCQRVTGGLRRFTYISTAYVAGEHAGSFSEDDLEVGQCFRNPYERSKFEAERILALAWADADHDRPPQHRRR